MKKIFLSFLFSFLIFTPSTSHSESSIKTFNLQDGSIIKGSVVSFENGIYQIQTTQLGEIQIPDSQIINITNQELTNATTNQAPATDYTPSQIKEKAQQAQTEILSNPELMADMKDLVADPEIQQLLSNPKLIQVITSYDPNQIEQNEDVQKLMQNPKMKMLMEKMLQKSNSSQTPSQ